MHDKADKEIGGRHGFELCRFQCALVFSDTYGVEFLRLANMRGPVRSLSSRIGARASATQAEKEDINSRSIYIGNVAYVCNAEDVRQHFEGCGTVNWVTIVTDTHCQPKGFAFLEFVEAEAVRNALLLDGSELRGRKLKVAAKRRPPPPPLDGYGRVPRIQRPIVRYGPY